MITTKDRNAYGTSFSAVNLGTSDSSETDDTEYCSADDEDFPKVPRRSKYVFVCTDMRTLIGHAWLVVNITQ